MGVCREDTPEIVFVLVNYAQVINLAAFCSSVYLFNYCVLITVNRRYNVVIIYGLVPTARHVGGTNPIFI